MIDEEVELDAVKNELNKMLLHGNLGYYNFCEVIQVILFFEKKAINYFTNIDFSHRHNQEMPFMFLTPKPISINNYKLAISRYTISVDQFLSLYCNAIQNGLWFYDGKEVIIDDAFVSEKKFVPASDPTGGQYNMFVPLEYGLYGSNFSGNYYIHELFSKKTILNEILEDSLIQKIQVEIRKSKLNFRLDKMKDRIGNVVCKFNVEVLESKPKSLGRERGIEYEFTLNKKAPLHKYCLSVFQEHDGMVYQNIIDNDFDCTGFQVDPNQCKTTISVLDITTGFTLFCGLFDYSVYSNYYSEITPPILVSQIPNKRILHLDPHDEIIQLRNVQMVGDIYSFCEMDAASKRKLKLHAEWFCENGYMKSYTLNEHENAINDILNIINSNLLWDLMELWVIDPYLSADDIISTVLKCEKKGIIIKALSAYSTIHNNKSTKVKMEASEFEAFKKLQSEKLESVLGEETDLKLEYRTVRNGYGVPFHDRYIMLKYSLNSDRVWSLGASLNSIGKCHSIIQIVETPDAILDLFEKLWRETENESCVLFSNIN